MFRTDSGAYGEIVPLLEQWQPDNPFWNLDDLLQYTPAIPRRNRQRHRWGTLTFLVKLKSMKRCVEGVWEAGLTWGDIKLRPILSYFHHWYRGLFSMTCRVLNRWAVDKFRLGDGCMNLRKTLEFFARVNAWESFLDTDRGDLCLHLGDVDGFYNNVSQNDLLEDMRRCARDSVARRRAWI